MTAAHRLPAWADALFLVLTGLALTSKVGPDLILVNESPSLPRGLYGRATTTPVRGAIVAWPPSSTARAYLRPQGFPHGAVLLKRVAAVTGDRVCREGSALSAPARTVGVMELDRRGAPLPQWRQCRALGDGEVFLLGDTAASFDSRYFGPVRRDETVVFRELLIW